MKRFLTLFLALILVVSLCACGGAPAGSAAPAESNAPAESPAPAESSAPAESPAPTESSAPADGGAALPTPDTERPDASADRKPYPNCFADGSVDPDTVANYDPAYDYRKNESFRVAYLSISDSPLCRLSADACERWCPLFHLEWTGFFSADGDNDLFLSTLREQIDQGVRGFILDPDPAAFSDVLGILEQHPDVFWMSQVSVPRDGASGNGIPIGGNLINNIVAGIDNTESGRIVARRLVRWKDETYPDIPWSEVGFLMMDFSASSPLHERGIGSEEVFLAAGGREENFFTADCLTTGLSMQGGIDAADLIVSAHPEIKCWLSNGLYDDLAQAAASVFEQHGLTDAAAIGVLGGSALIQQWDAGQESSFRFAVFIPQSLYAEPVIGSLAAFLNGWVTPDSIWPSWVKWDDHGVDGHSYSQLCLPYAYLEHDNYQKYLAWLDLFTQSDDYSYSTQGVNLSDFSSISADVPAGYRKP